MIALIVVCSLLSSVFYRAGGLSQDQEYWIPAWMRHSWVRDWLCPLVCLLPLFLQHPSWLYGLTYGVMGGMFSTYWKYKGKPNFWLAGFMVGMAAAPLFFCGFVWWRLLLRAILIALWWGSWSNIFGNDHVEEHGRGFFASIFNLVV